MEATEIGSDDPVHIVAIVRSTCLERVEKALQDSGVEGVTVSHAKGYGEYANFFAWNPLVRVVRIEIFAARSRVDAVVAIIAGAACTGQAGDGIVAVTPVERLQRIRDWNAG